MCSVGDDEEEKLKFLPKKTTVNLKDSICIKCRTVKPQIVLHGQYPYCKNCFLSATLHKFKAVLGKNRIVHPNDNVLIYHKTGHASTALLHFLRTGLDLTTPKKIRFRPVVAFIENNFTLDLHQRLQILKQIDDEVKKFNFPIFYVNLAQYISNSCKFSPKIINEKFMEIELAEDDGNYVTRVMSKNANLTIQTEVLKVFEQELLIKVTKCLECKCIFTPDLGIDIASQLLTNVSLGRGELVAFDTGTVDSRNVDVTILRPLRNFSIKELAFYNFFNNIEPVTYLTRKTNPYSSIQNLMEKFVTDLQGNYPATISTIVRTGDKLGPNKNSVTKKCILCQAPLGVESELLGSAEATNFSHWVSTQSPIGDISEQNRSSHLLRTFNNSSYGKYCFSCNRIAPFLCK